VTIVPVRLPPAVACMWLGYEKAEYIGYNQDWPVPAIEMIAHTTGHLVLQHCGTVRDCGQFAYALASGLDPVTRDQLRAILHDPDATPGRLFTAAEEHEAEHFATVHLDHLGEPTTLARQRQGEDLAFVCVG
jgi:hypothetical protein